MTDNQTFVMGINPNTNIKELKLKIEDRLGVPNHYHQLFQNGKLLPDNFMFNRHNIKLGMVVLLYFLFR